MSDWREADRLLEEAIVADGDYDDEALLKLLYRWSWRQVALLEGVVGNEMWNVKLQPLADLVID